MSDQQEMEQEERSQPRSVEMPRPRAVGAPLSSGSSRPASPPAAESELRPLPTRASPSLPPLSAPPDEKEPGEEIDDPPSSLQRAMGGLRAAWPFVQKILPLLDGQVITAVSNLLAPTRPMQPPVNLAPLQDGLVELHSKQMELREQITEQNASLKRVEDRLEQVREATDRNTLEQQELMEDLKSVGRKANRIAIFAIFLLAVSIAVNVVLFLHIQHVLP